MPAAAVHKTQAHNFPLYTEPSLPGPSKHHATCAWCLRNWRSIVELIDHVHAAHLDQSDTASEESATCSTEEV
jgi:hypothetical protein